MRHKSYSYAKYGYIFSIPFVVAFLVFSLYPLVYTFTISFTDLQGLAQNDYGVARESVYDDDGEPVIDPDTGEQKTRISLFMNFKSIFQNELFKTSFKNTVKIWIINFIPQLLLAIVLAAWFTRRRNKLKGEGVFKVLFYMPNIITAASIAILFSVLFMYPVGPINYLLSHEVLGILDEPYPFNTNKTVAQITVAFIQFWMWYGYTMLILISGINGLNPEMFESADIDGANGTQQFFFITLPNLKTIMLYTLVTSLIGGLNMFDVPKVYLDGGPANATVTTSVFIYGQAFSGRYFYNRAAAASLIMFVVIAILSIGLFFLMRDKEAAAAAKAARRARRAARGGGLL